MSVSTSFSQTPHGGTEQPAVRKSTEKQGNHPAYSPLPTQYPTFKADFYVQLSFETVLIDSGEYAHTGVAWSLTVATMG